MLAWTAILGVTMVMCQGREQGGIFQGREQGGIFQGREQGQGGISLSLGMGAGVGEPGDCQHFLDSLEVRGIRGICMTHRTA